MIPGKYDIIIWKGGTLKIILNADGLDFNVYDEIRMQVRPPWTNGKPVSQSPLLLLNKTNGRIAVSDDGLSLTLTVTADETAAFVFNGGIYDLELVQNADPMANPPILAQVVHKLIYGTVTIKGEVTK